MDDQADPLTTQLRRAIVDNHLEQVAALLDAGADVEAHSATEWGSDRAAALVHAAHFGRVRVALLLLERGAHVDGASMYKQTPLIAASKCGRVRVAEVLVAHGADLEATDNLGLTALLRAFNFDHADVAMMLLEHGARVDAVSASGCTVLHYAMVRAYSDVERLFTTYPGVVGLVNSATVTDGRRPLHGTAARGSVPHLRLLLDAGAEVNVVDHSGRTPLHWACGAGQVEAMRELVQRGAEVDAVDDEGETPLVCVVSARTLPLRDRVEAVRLLLQLEADRSIPNGEGETARDVAEARGLDEVVEVLDTCFPFKRQVVQVLLGLRGPPSSALTRFASHSAFEPQVLSIVVPFLSGEGNCAFYQLEREAVNRGDRAGS